MTEFPVNDEDIKALRIKLLRGLAAATYPKEAIAVIAGNHKLTVPDVQSMVRDYGYPDRQAMAEAAIELSGGTPRPANLVVTQPTTTVPAVRTTLSAALPPLTTDTILAFAEKSTKARTRRVAARVRAQLAELRGLVNTEKADREKAEKDEAEKAKLTAEVAALELALAQKKAALRGPRVAKKTATPGPAGQVNRNSEIRDWARDQGITVGGSGRIPRAVVDAFDEAHGGEREQQ